MRWIKYQVAQGVNGEDVILIDKRIPYNSANLIIAKAEAYDGYTLVEYSESFDKEPLDVPFGGTGASTKKGAIENLGIYPVGSVYITSTYKNPSSFLGGTWECFDKNLAYEVYDYREDTGFFTPSANTRSWTGFVTVEGHLATIKLEIFSDVQAGESDAVWGKFNFKKMGFDMIYYSITPAMCSGDSANLLMMGSLHFETGEFRTYDVVPKTDGGLLEPGQGFVTTFTVPISSSAMYNSFCDKFYWKRTA